jgi:type I restriction enzyme S subunit
MTGRYKAYPSYKESGAKWLGNIPSTWVVKKLKYLCQIQTGTKDTVNAVDNGKYPFFVRSQTIEKINSVGANCEAVLTAGDGVGVGKVYHYFNGKFDFHQRVYMLNNFNTVSGRFVYYYLSSNFYKVAMEGNAKSTVDSLRLPQFLNFEFSLPAMEEQNKIVNFLDHETAKIDTLITKQEKLIELLKEKRQAVISHAVTKGLPSVNGEANAPMKDSGVEWLGEVPEHWSVGRVKNLAKLISKGTTPSTIGGDFIDDGIRFLKGENIGKSLFVNPSPTFYISEDVDAQLSRSRLQENDVLVIIAGATTGKASILTKELLPANTNQAVSFIRPKKTIYSKLITLWLSTEFAQRIIWMGAVQAAQPNLSMENLGNLPIVLPDEDEIAPLLNEIDKKVEQFDALTIKANSAIELMKERKTALISAAVTGKIDVRHFVAEQEQPQGVQDE